jgi:hypothetical protein
MDCLDILRMMISASSAQPQVRAAAVSNMVSPAKKL